MQLPERPSNINNPTGQTGGGVSGGADLGGTAPASAGGFLPAAGGGMIAPAAGGDQLRESAFCEPACQRSGRRYLCRFRLRHRIPWTSTPIRSERRRAATNTTPSGPKQQSGDRAYGRYQVMGSNVGPWTQQVLGQAMSPSDFLNNPQAQDAVFKAKFGQSLQQYNNPADAASVWFSGRPMGARRERVRQSRYDCSELRVEVPGGAWVRPRRLCRARWAG